MSQLSTFPVDRVRTWFHELCVLQLLHHQTPTFPCSRQQLAAFLNCSRDHRWLYDFAAPVPYVKVPPPNNYTSVKYTPSPESLTAIQAILEGSLDYRGHELWLPITNIIHTLVLKQCNEPSQDPVYVRNLLRAQEAIHDALYTTMQTAWKTAPSWYISLRRRESYSYTLFQDPTTGLPSNHPVYVPGDMSKYPLPDKDSPTWFEELFDHIAEGVRTTFPNIQIKHSTMTDVVRVTHARLVEQGVTFPAQVACIKYFQRRYGLIDARITPSIDPFDKVLEDIYLYGIQWYVESKGMTCMKEWFNLSGKDVRTKFMGHMDTLVAGTTIKHGIECAIESAGSIQQFFKESHVII